MRRILEIRELKKKPKLSDVLNMIEDRSDPKQKEILLEKMKKLYQKKDVKAQ